MVKGVGLGCTVPTQLAINQTGDFAIPYGSNNGNLLCQPLALAKVRAVYHKLPSFIYFFVLVEVLVMAVPIGESRRKSFQEKSLHTARF